MSPSTDGTRSREGCFACRLRRRKCDGVRPVCTRCLKSRVSTPCEWPETTPVAKFLVTVGPHTEIHQKDDVKHGHFINFSRDELPRLCTEYSNDAETAAACTVSNIVSFPPLVQQPSAYSVFGHEASLIQYYTEVVSNSRVYVPGGANLFQTLVVPTILTQDGPLRSTILSLSSAERTRDSYDRVALHYKQKALRDLHQTVSDPQHAGESLMACVLQASLEIASGSRPAWLHHLGGSLAILKAFGPCIDDEAASFALSYFYLRYNLLRTTLELSPDTSPENEYNMQLEMLTQERLHHSFGEMAVSVVDKHLGCSIELLSLISKISELSVEVRTRALADGLQERAFLLEDRLHNTTFTCVDPDYEYLLTSAETFKLAARIYLRLVCWKTGIQDEEVVRLQEQLLQSLACVLGETQPRRSFPMWPLFIAGCVSSQETHRKAVADMFTTINGKWPVSNISTVWRALQTIWKSRDLVASTADSPEHQDWQQVVGKFRWRLALT